MLDLHTQLQSFSLVVSPAARVLNVQPQLLTAQQSVLVCTHITYRAPLFVQIISVLCKWWLSWHAMQYALFGAVWSQQQVVADSSS